MYPKQYITFILVLLVWILSYQAYVFSSLWNKLEEAKIGFWWCNSSAPAINITGWNDTVPDMVWGC